MSSTWFCSPVTDNSWSTKTTSDFFSHPGHYSLNHMKNCESMEDMLCPGAFWTCLGTECQREMHAKHQVGQSRSSRERLQHSRAFPSPWQRILLEARENPELESVLPEENKPHRKRFPIPWQRKEQKEYLSSKQTKRNYKQQPWENCLIIGCSL